MAQDEGDYRLEDIVFGPAERRLIRRYHAVLSQAASGRVDPQKLYFAAASATECLRLGRQDALLLRRAGLPANLIAEHRAVSRDDARFYIDLAMTWIAEATPRAA